MDANTYWLASSSGVVNQIAGDDVQQDEDVTKSKEADLSLVNQPPMVNFANIFAGASAAVASSAAAVNSDSMNGEKSFMLGQTVPSLNQITIPSANQLSKRSGIFPISGTLPGMATINNIGMQNTNVIISANATQLNIQTGPIQQVSAAQSPFTSAQQLTPTVTKDFIQQAAAESGVTMAANGDSTIMQTNIFSLPQQVVSTSTPTLTGSEVTHASTSDVSADEQQPLKCNECNKTFEKAGQLRFHGFVAHAQLHMRPHKCSLCPESFLAAHHLQDHLKAVHLSNDQQNATVTFTCSECHASFTNGGQLNYHIYTAHTVHGPRVMQHMCSQCGKSFMKASLLNSHMKNVHGTSAINLANLQTAMSNNSNQVQLVANGDIQAESEFSCKDCGKSFKSANLLKQHALATHSKPHKCQECGKTFGRRSDLNRHMRGVHMRERPHSCNKCGWTFAEAGNLKHHMQAVHSKKRNFHCPICAKSFSIHSYLKTHLSRAHNITDTTKGNAHLTPSSLSNTTNTQQQVFTIQTVPQQQAQQQQPQQQQQATIATIQVPVAESQVNRCFECGQVFSNATMLQNHVMSTHPHPFWCTVCGEGFSQAFQLQAHLQARHSDCNSNVTAVMNLHDITIPAGLTSALIDQSVAELRQPLSEVLAEKCNACGEIVDKSSKGHVCAGIKFQQAALTAAAAMAMAGERPHLCTKCGKGFKTATHLKQHVRCVHTKDRPHKCSRCGKTFARMSDLNRHIKGVHERQKPVQKGLRILSLKCTECGSTFSETSQLKRHILTVHLHQRPCYKCADCQEGFADEMTFKNHICHEDERPHVCNVCSKRFVETTQLRRHIRSAHSHHGSQPQHKCFECRRTFTRPVDLDRHIHAVHLKEKPHKCGICGKFFGLHGNLNKHVRAVHMLEKPHQCVECGKCFAHIGVLKRHLRDIHFYDKRPGKKSVKPSPLMVDPQPDNANNDVLSPDGQPISHLTVLQALEAIQQEHQEQQQHLLQADTNNVQQQQQAMAMHQQPAQVVPQSPHVLQDNLAHPPPTPQRTR